MATSRTGTASYKRWRTAVLRAGRKAGVTRCPLCEVELDYEHGRKPNSAEPDHIIAWAVGGTNTVDNGRVICRRCNQKRGKGGRENSQSKREAASRRTITTLINW